MDAMDQKPEFKPFPGQDERGVDLTQIRELLLLTPAERIRLLVADARNLARFDEAIRRIR